VRGAYLEKENKRAEELGYESPIWKTKAQTDKAFDDALIFCLLEGMELCIATHNEESVEKAMPLIQKNDGEKLGSVCFAQLFGMSDHITYNLADKGYTVAKYLPFGPMELSLPYLFRRANENKAVAGQSGRELELLKKELKRRKKATSIR
jgi:proline dehydrogenase